MNVAQLKSRLRQIDQKHRQAVSNYNNAARRFNAGVNNYNREVRAHNARVRANQQRLRTELAKLSSQTVVLSRHITYRASVRTLHQSFIRIEVASERADWRGNDELLDLSERETANSIAVLNALTDGAGAIDDGANRPAIRTTAITSELISIDPDLDARWGGALYALNARNPDAARHFCTSSREILTRILETSAPDADVMAADPNCDTTQDGRVTRRARILYCLRRRGHDEAELADFVEEDLENVVTLFRDFNEGAHGGAGRYSIAQLGALKIRVEDAIQFLCRLAA